MRTETRMELGSDLLEAIDGDSETLTVIVGPDGAVRWVGALGCRALLGCEPEDLRSEALVIAGLMGGEGRTIVLDPRGQGPRVVRGRIMFPAVGGRASTAFSCTATTTSSGSTVLRLSDPRRPTASDFHNVRARDQLTGVLAASEMASLARDLEPNGEWLLLMVELERWQQIEQRAGAFGCDSVLRTIAARLQAFFREGDLVIRADQRRFAIVVRSDGGPGWPESMAERLMLAIGGPIPLQDEMVSVGCSIGLLTGSNLPDDSDPFDMAAQALHASQVQGGGRWTRVSLQH